MFPADRADGRREKMFSADPTDERRKNFLSAKISGISGTKKINPRKSVGQRFLSAPAVSFTSYFNSLSAARAKKHEIRRTAPHHILCLLPEIGPDFQFRKIRTDDSRSGNRPSRNKRPVGPVHPVGHQH